MAIDHGALDRGADLLARRARRLRGPPPRALAATLALLLDHPHVGVEVDLDRVAGRAHVALAHLLVVLLDALPHLVAIRKRRLALEDVGHPLRLRLGERHDRAERLHEADE